MTPKVFTFNFDVEPAKNLRDAINEKQNLSIEKEHEIKDAKTKKFVPYFAWDRICAIMDRVEDTLDYLNLIELGNCCSSRSAFDFYDFINNAYVVIDGIKIIGQIFALDNTKIDSIEKSQEAFGDVLNAGGTDGQFFNYIRSLCAVHPFNTTRHPVYMKDSVLHCCPFVVWTHSGIGSFWSDGRDLSAHVYTSKRNKDMPSIPLYINTFEKYINKWISLIPEVITAINNYNDLVYEEYRKSPLKTITDFSTEAEYIFYLKQEYNKRFGDSMEYIFDKIACILETNLTNEENAKKLEKYKTAIRYALPFICNSMKKMQAEGFECTGIQGENPTHTNLLFEVEHPDVYSDELSKYHYNLSKVYYLESNNYSVYDKSWARTLLDEMNDFLNKYVVFTNEESDKEVVILVDLVRYLYALEQNCTLNRNIPNELSYREKLLSEKEMASLIKATNETDELAEDVIIKITDPDGNVLDKHIIEAYLK